MRYWYDDYDGRYAGDCVVDAEMAYDYVEAVVYDDGNAGDADFLSNVCCSDGDDDAVEVNPPKCIECKER